MPSPPRQFVVIAGVLLLAGAAAVLFAYRSTRAGVYAAFWFESVAFGTSEPMADKLGGAITPQELGTIEIIAFGEVTRAFEDFRVSFTNRRGGWYRVRVVQRIQHPLDLGTPAPSGESLASPGLGGQGRVNFQILANQAIAYSPAGADRPAMIAAIGRGVGRAAVHEFAHQFLGRKASIHSSTDVNSYEYASADRREQYFGELRWDIARPLLEKRLGTR